MKLPPTASCTALMMAGSPAGSSLVTRSRPTNLHGNGLPVSKGRHASPRPSIKGPLEARLLACAHLWAPSGDPKLLPPLLTEMVHSP